MNHPQLTLEAQDDQGIGLRLQFFWQGDRYAHRISLLTAATAEHEWLRSIEGDHVGAWPPSPPFQQGSLHEAPGGESVALLVGMAGRSHWSLSVTARPRRLVFDVACRVHPPSGWLGSSYRSLLPGLTRQNHGDPGVQWVLERYAARVQIQQTPESEAAGLDAEADHVQIRAEPTNSLTAATTVRWQYEVALVNRAE